MINKNSSSKIEKRRHPRFIKRLTANFVVENEKFVGITSDLSASGLFIRTSKGFVPGTAINIELIMPDNRLSSLKGIVRRTVKTPISSMKNGMGVGILVQDGAYAKFLKNVYTAGKKNIDKIYTSTECEIHSCSKTTKAEPLQKEIEQTISERRKHKRFIPKNRNFYGNISINQNVDIINIGLGGIMVKTDKRLNINTEYMLKLGYRDETLSVKARTLWSLIIESQKNRYGDITPIYIVGMQFSKISENIMDKLQNIIKSHELEDYDRHKSKILNSGDSIINY